MEIPQIESSIMPWIGRTGKLMSIFVVDKFKKYNLNLTIEQWILLKYLHHEDGLMQNDLAEITNRNKTSLTRLIHTMEKHRLVARISDSVDKRVNRIFLTKNGKKIFKSTFPIIEEAKRELEFGLTDKEIKSLIKILKKVQGNIKTVKDSCTTN
jgi:DNA-binding MarR family transcriptional regulator